MRNATLGSVSKIFNIGSKYSKLASKAINYNDK
jgi:hypothetical protein